MMSDIIPSDIYYNILGRLPAETLLLLRGVCKSWRQMIDDPDCIRSHILNYHHKSDSGLGQQLLIINRFDGKLTSLSLDFSKSDQQDIIEATQVKNLFGCGLHRPDSTLPVLSCNGLILIPQIEPKKLWVLWNPLTQEYHELPQCEADYDGYLDGFGLWYDSANHDYKVVRLNVMVLFGQVVDKTMIYSLRFDSWKRIEDCLDPPYYHNTCTRRHGKHLNGVLYWLSKDSVLGLDLATEHYRQFSMPLLRPRRTVLRVMNLDVLDGCLVFSCTYMKSNSSMDGFGGFEGWVMQDDGGEISWNKLFSLSESLEPDIGSWKNLRLVTYSKSLGRVLLQNDHVFYWLNTENNSAKKVQVHGLRGNYDGNFYCQVWQGSIFRLGNVVAVERIGRVRKRKVGVRDYDHKEDNSKGSHFLN